MSDIPTIPVWDLVGVESDGNVKYWQRFSTEEEARIRLEERSSAALDLSYSIRESLSIVPDRTLPTPEQIRGLCAMLHKVLILIRSMGYGGKTEALIDLTDGLHNLPVEMFDPMRWDWNLLEVTLDGFEKRFPEYSYYRLSETVRKIRNRQADQ
jgi:hypothetical protein